jgi:ABC-type transporter Mla subunit MlaD
MNEAVSRALGRAGELEALVHNEVTALERSYEDNERRIRSLIQELSGERNALLNTTERVNEALKSIASEVPVLIEKLSGQQAKLAATLKALRKI